MMEGSRVPASQKQEGQYHFVCVPPGRAIVREGVFLCAILVPMSSAPVVLQTIDVLICAMN